jgi:ubiquinone/menaquinone biosynthesis C-methylase UbiE
LCGFKKFIRGRPLHNGPDELASSLFQTQWQTYPKIVDNNYTFHREAYSELHRILVDEAIPPFRFLDIACGDDSATVNSLKGTRIAHCHGIDLSQAVLDLAKTALETLARPIILERRDFVEALRDRPEPVDVAWIGYSLHHRLALAKLTLREIRDVVGDRGMFLICELASPTAGEDRGAWLSCYERLNQPLWSVLNSKEWEAMAAHVRAADFPEANSRWHSRP